MTKEKWMQLVIVRFDDVLRTPERHEFGLYRAHRFSCSVGDTVLVEEPGKYGTVVFEDNVHFRTTDHLKHIAKVNRVEWPIPAVKKVVQEYDVVFDEDDWSSEDEEEDDDAVRTE